MAESTLSLGFVEFQKAVMRFLGYGVDSTKWTAAQIAEVDDIVQSGYRQFLYPPKNESIPDGYVWTFLKPTTTLTTIPSYTTGTVTVTATVCTLVGGVWPTWAATNGTLWINDVEYSVTTRTDNTNLVVVGSDVSTATSFELTHNGNYTMPDDFGGIDSLITIEDMYGYPPLSIVHEGKVRALRQQDYSITGVPYLSAIRPKTSDGATGQRMEMILYPRPDAAYTLSYTYFSLPNKLTTTAPYPLGGMIHAETIQESCLAIAEQNSDDAEGLHKNKFYERLLASIDKDKVVNGVRNYGYNGDGPTYRRDCERVSQVSYNGVVYTGE